MTQFESFRQYLGTFLSVPPLEWLQMVQLLRLRQLKKDDFYYEQGQEFDEIGFVAKGLLYNFYTTESGKVHVKHFVDKGQPVAPYANLILETKTSFSCKALEDSTLITLKYADLQKLYARHSCWERMGRISAEKIFITHEARQLTFLSMTATERYEHFVKSQPDLHQRIPQYLIASYLGMSPISLSRIRKTF
jgi:CRP-like cAMP-binding protein